jgi:hypothetical protein
MAVLTIFVALVVTFVVWYHIKYHQRNKLLSKIPAYKSYPLIGSNLSLAGKSTVEMFKTFEKASKELGPAFRIDISPFRSLVLMSDVKFLEGLLSSQKHIEKSSGYDYVKDWMGDGETYELNLDFLLFK